MKYKPQSAHNVLLWLISGYTARSTPVRMNARFLVEDIATIDGRGAVAMGRILEGDLNVGMFTQPLRIRDQTKPLKITGVEVAHTIPRRQPKIGLLFDRIPADDLRGALPEDFVLAIFELVEDARRAV